ncbi:winged helix-turn-helix transcriptional regulator [Halalkaliarchaeum sp. AArc-GB]|uniref:winged helix-turn-helix transcriptional regulator n=1 Tax=Halalkaliarchaeum sp. AArc-GB TaxID=3074078 RepID=UPI00285E1921|nr:winged helix-turn-helix transcriptional regulator [Halalkaliarchaeum sp. AArc-GB]MDR5674041.1 winged helix-turn-helix transcriptional regulator [Halalkaliarchaeum sp. AArc-GB]
MTATDDRILEILNSEGRSTPKNLAETDFIHRSRPTVNQRLQKLEEAGLVEKEGRGLYKVTDNGRLYLIGGYDVSEREKTIEIEGEGAYNFDRVRVEIRRIINEYL